MSIPFSVDPPAVQVSPPQPADIEIRWDHRYKKGARGCAHCKQARFAQDHLGLPLSLNEIGSRGGHFTYKTAKEAWEEAYIEALRQTHLPAGWETEIWTPVPGTPQIGSIYVEALITFPIGAQVERDQGNFRWFVEKCLGDALVKGGWIEDDSYWPTRHYECGGLQMQYEKGVGSTRLMLMPS